MIRHLFVLFLMLVLGAGCSRVPQKVAGTPAPALPEYDPKHGVRLPEQTRQALGLRIADVEERVIDASLRVSLRVFEVKPEYIRASGRVNPEQARVLEAGLVAVAHPAGHSPFTGTVVRVGDPLRGTSGAGEVLVNFVAPPPHAGVAPFLDVDIPLPPGDATTTIPASALLESSEGLFVFVVSGDHFVRTRVEAGRMNDAYVEITDGLYEGDQVVAEPVLSLWMTELAAVKGGQSCCAVSPEVN